MLGATTRTIYPITGVRYIIATIWAAQRKSPAIERVGFVALFLYYVLSKYSGGLDDRF